MQWICMIRTLRKAMPSCNSYSQPVNSFTRVAFSALSYTTRYPFCFPIFFSGQVWCTIHNSTFCIRFFFFFDQDLAYSSSLGSRLLMAVYKGIAPGENRKSLPSMDVSSRKLANGLVQLAFSLGDQVSTS